MTYHLVHGECLDVMRTIKSVVADAIICDPPYPEVDRAYGRMTEVDWRTMMDALIVEARRVLKPWGSAMFVLQPNSETHGRMRSWLWRFMADYADSWGMVQDVWWWNWGAMPLAGTRREIGLLRGSLKACVWLGPAHCYRDQGAVLWETSDSVKALTREGRAFRTYTAPSGHEVNKTKTMASSVERGGVTPFNVIPLGNTDSRDSGGIYGHPAATPYKLAEWWVRYICPPDGLVIDPFSGSGTVALAADRNGRNAIGIERDATYHAMATRRLAGLPPVDDVPIDVDAAVAES